MSVFEEYEEIIRNIGNDKWHALNLYLLDNSHDSVASILENSEKWNKFNTWYNTIVRNRKVEITNIWELNQDDIAFEYNLYQGNKRIANSISSIPKHINSKFVINYKNIDKKCVKEEIIQFTYNNFDNFKDLPKISECSKLLQEVYDGVRSSDASLFHIDNNDWEEMCDDGYNQDDLHLLEDEIKKFDLEDVIEINDGKYKIVGYEDLETRFNDDRDLNNEKQFKSQECER